MVIRVATKHFGDRVLGGECVALQPDGEVQLELRGEVNGALVHTLEAVEHWLERTGTASAEVWVDERSYRVEQRQLAPANSTPSSR